MFYDKINVNVNVNAFQLTYSEICASCGFILMWCGFISCEN